MRNLYGIIRADGVELKQDTITTLKWFDDKLQEEHQKMLASIANLKTAAESQHAVTGEQLVHADKVFEEFRTNVINGINAQGNSLQESLEKQEQTAKDVQSQLKFLSDEIQLGKMRHMETKVQLMAASHRYEELERVLGERLASYLSDQKERRRGETSRGRRKPAGKDDVVMEGNEEAGGEATGTPEGDGVEVGMGGEGGGRSEEHTSEL